jgi:hypothetical protein
MSSTPASTPPAAPWLAHLRREAERFAQVVTQSPQRAHVPAYPDFTVHSLAIHIGRVLLVWKRAVPPRPGLDVTGSADVLKRFLTTDYIPDPRTTPAH